MLDITIHFGNVKQNQRETPYIPVSTGKQTENSGNTKFWQKWRN